MIKHLNLLLLNLKNNTNHIMVQQYVYDFLRISINRNYSGKLLKEVDFCVLLP